MENLCSISVEYLSSKKLESPYKVDLYGLKSIVSILYSVVNINTTYSMLLFFKSSVILNLIRNPLIIAAIPRFKRGIAVRRMQDAGCLTQGQFNGIFLQDSSWPCKSGMPRPE